MSLSKNDIKLAMKKYDQGDRPFKFKKPRSWYVYGINSKNLYPFPLSMTSDSRTSST